MRFVTVLLLLIAAALLASGDVAARTGHFEGPTATRVLRDVDNEDRALDEPSMASFTKWVKSLTDNVQARYWLWSKKSMDGIFKKVDGGSLGALLNNPKKLKELETYINLVNKKNPDNTVSLAGAISNTYGDAALAQELEHALNNPLQKEMAARLALQQRQNWEAEGKTVEQIFIKLKLNEAGDDLYQTPQLNSWFEYVTMVEKEDPNAAMISVLTSHYGDDYIAKIFLNRNQRMRSVRLKLETAMVDEWLRKGYTSDDMFELLKLDENVDTVLTNQALDMWIRYFDRYNAKNPEKQTTIFQTFTKFFDDEPLARMLATAKTAPNTKEMATRLQEEQFKQWLGDKSTDDVFKLLKLDGDVDNLLTNPNLSTWISYARLFNLNNPGKRTTWMQTFTKFYGREELAEMLEAAKKVPETEELAKKFQAAQFKQWFEDGVKPPEIWEMLNKEKEIWTTNDEQIWALYESYYEQNKRIWQLYHPGESL